VYAKHICGISLIQALGNYEFKILHWKHSICVNSVIYGCTNTL